MVSIDKNRSLEGKAKKLGNNSFKYADIMRIRKFEDVINGKYEFIIGRNVLYYIRSLTGGSEDYSKEII